MKKCIYIIYLLLLGSSLNAMLKAPDVTHWQDMCDKDEHKKKEIVTVYKDFCQERFKKNISWAIGSWIPLLIPKTINNAIQEMREKVPLNVRDTYSNIQKRVGHKCNSLSGITSKNINYAMMARMALGLFALRQTYLLIRNAHRANLAEQADLSYLNNDVLEQLGHPKVDNDFIHYYPSGKQKYARLLGMYIPYKEVNWRRDYYRIRNVNSIKQALSGKHPSYE